MGLIPHSENPVSQGLSFDIVQRPAEMRRQITSFSGSFLPRIRTWNFVAEWECQAVPLV